MIWPKWNGVERSGSIMKGKLMGPVCKSTTESSWKRVEG